MFSAHPSQSLSPTAPLEARPSGHPPPQALSQEAGRQTTCLPAQDAGGPAPEPACGHPAHHSGTGIGSQIYVRSSFEKGLVGWGRPEQG
jgi:hypothetical protein